MKHIFETIKSLKESNNLSFLKIKDVLLFSENPRSERPYYSGIDIKFSYKDYHIGISVRDTHDEWVSNRSYYSVIVKDQKSKEPGLYDSYLQKMLLDDKSLKGYNLSLPDDPSSYIHGYVSSLDLFIFIFSLMFVIDHYLSARKLHDSGIRI